MKDVQKFYSCPSKEQPAAARKLDMDQCQQPTPCFRPTAAPYPGPGPTEEEPSLNGLAMDDLLLPEEEDRPKAEFKRPPALNMDLIGEGSYPCTNLTPSQGHEILVPIPRPPLSPIMSLPPSSRPPIARTGNDPFGLSPMRPMFSPSGHPASFTQLASTPTLLTSIDKIFKPHSDGNN